MVSFVDAEVGRVVAELARLGMRDDTVVAFMSDHGDMLGDHWMLNKGPFHFDDYVDYVRDWITLLSPGVHVISVCQPTVPVLAAVSLMAQRGEAQRKNIPLCCQDPAFSASGAPTPAVCDT